MKDIEQGIVDRQATCAGLAQLGRLLGHVGRGEPWPGHSCGLNQSEYEEWETTLARAYTLNKWFTVENQRAALLSWSAALTEEGLVQWLSLYPATGAGQKARTVGLVLAGNIPMVGMHDIICVLLSGHRAKVKLSSQDEVLLTAVLKCLDRFLPGTMDRIVLEAGKLSDIDAVIATGSNNTSRYFEHYFGHMPRVIRKNRTSIALLDGTETEAELTALGEDLFRYFGMGCRNVSKLLVPNDFDLDRIFGAIFHWRSIVEHNKYGNNYDYVRALWMLDQEQFLENGFVLFKEDKALVSPMGSVFIQRYDSAEEAHAYVKENANAIQCIVGHGHIAFGQAQHPALWDYADGVDTMQFLRELP